MFKYTENNTEFEYKILTTNDYKILENIFDRCLLENGFNVKEIKFIEGLLFLSMIPLHKDNFDRQKIFYLKSIELLNSTIRIKNKDRVEWKKRNLEYASI